MRQDVAREKTATALKEVGMAQLDMQKILAKIVERAKPTIKLASMTSFTKLGSVRRRAISAAADVTRQVTRNVKGRSATLRHTAPSAAAKKTRPFADDETLTLLPQPGSRQLSTKALKKKRPVKLKSRDITEVLPAPPPIPAAAKQQAKRKARQAELRSRVEARRAKIKAHAEARAARKKSVIKSPEQTPPPTKTTKQKKPKNAEGAWQRWGRGAATAGAVGTGGLGLGAGGYALLRKKPQQ